MTFEEMTVKEKLDYMRKNIEHAETKNATIPVLKSRYTPGLKNGKGVAFQKGDVVSYRTRKGEKYRITIVSERMQHESGYFGYEAMFDDGKYFAVEDGIYDWAGKGNRIRIHNNKHPRNS